MVNVGFLVNRRIGLKKEGKLHEELVSFVYTHRFDMFNK
jgi:hypothetical protein